MSDLVVLIALVKYPMGTYLTANSIVVEAHNADTLNEAAMMFKNEIEVQGCRVVNFLAYIVPRRQIVDAHR
jgi:hypothetical protein